MITGLQLLALTAISQFRVTFVIDSYPEKADAELYLSGSFNMWDPGRKDYMFQEQNGKQTLSIFLGAGHYEYKITRGTWGSVEENADFSPFANREMEVDADTTVPVTIGAWADDKPSIDKTVTHTASSRVHILDTAFYMPQLKRYRRIWIYLPESYERTKKKFPVLYMHDGQNVFDAATSYSGEWGVDEFLDTLCANCRESIVVAVDNGLERRMNEYNPWAFQKFGKGEGDQYVDFLVKTLKPFIDNHYRTYKSKKYTSVAGSSMGGLISLYAVLKYPGVFGSAGIFSPAFWTANGIDSTVLAGAKKVNSNLFFYAGGKESESMVSDMQRIENMMDKLSKSQIKEIVDENAHHNEAAWRKHFSEFYEWVFCKGGKEECK